MSRRQAAIEERAPQRDCLLLAVALAEQLGFKQIEMSELAGRAKRCVVRDIIGGPHEIVERKNKRAVPRMNDKGGNREVLVAVSLAGSQFSRSCHRASLATRSFARQAL